MDNTAKKIRSLENDIENMQEALSKAEKNMSAYEEEFSEVIRNLESKLENSTSDASQLESIASVLSNALYSTLSYLANDQIFDFLLSFKILQSGKDAEFKEALEIYSSCLKQLTSAQKLELVNYHISGAMDAFKGTKIECVQTCFEIFRTTASSFTSLSDLDNATKYLYDLVTSKFTPDSYKLKDSGSKAFNELAFQSTVLSENITTFAVIRKVVNDQSAKNTLQENENLEVRKNIIKTALHSVFASLDYYLQAIKIYNNVQTLDKPIRHIFGTKTLSEALKYYGVENTCVVAYSSVLFKPSSDIDKERYLKFICEGLEVSLTVDEIYNQLITSKAFEASASVLPPEKSKNSIRF